MHEIGHLAEDSERSPEDIAGLMRTNGTYSMLEEEISRQKALDFLVENATPVPMPEEEETEENEELAEVEEPIEATAVATEKDEREE
jgi:trigger factor